MFRFRMNKIVRLLEADQEEAVLELASSRKYRKALLALEASGAVRLLKDFGGKILDVSLLDSYALYQLNRREIWINRLWGFLAGVATSVVAHAIISLIW